MSMITTALRKISALTKRIWVVRGGQGAGKTFAILMLIANYASSNPNKEILIVSEELTKMRLTVIKDFKKVMQRFEVYEDQRFIADTLYKFPNGSFIKFIGLDKEDIGKGLRSDLAYFNEVNKVSKEAYRQISSRAKRIIADYNPDTRFFIDEDVIGRDDCDFLQLTFEDNEYLSKEERNEILSYKEKGFDEEGNEKDPYWANLWKVYGKGEIGNLEGVVYPEWREIKELPKEAKLIGYGVDFGWTNPAAGVAIYKWNNEIIYDEILYGEEMSNADIAQALKDYGIKKWHVGYADSAEPKSISEIKKKGLTIKGADKSNDNIRYGIKLVKSHPFYYTSRSTHMKKEAQGYVWDKKASKEVPVKKEDHAMDAKRYGALGCLEKKKSFRVKGA